MDAMTLPLTAENRSSPVFRQQAGLSIDSTFGGERFSVRQLYRYERGESRPRKAVIHFLQEKIRIAPPSPAATPVSHSSIFLRA